MAAADELVLMVKDNGVGISERGMRSGLHNLEQRTAALGGSLVIGPADSGGNRTYLARAAQS